MTYKMPKAAYSLVLSARHLLQFHDVHNDVNDVQNVSI